ncbi:hypothetical protein K1719_000323 [Acacia pycnantha]|nr:hypothetical protein K1719_000323 [Acacia pycnantha]
MVGIQLNDSHVRLLGSITDRKIFQCLASMPDELEGYIRPGCTILTAFLLEYYLQDIAAPRKMLFGRGTIFFNLNDMVFCILKERGFFP